MSLSRYERKEKLPWGAQKEIAEALEVDESLVSRVNSDKAYHDDPKKVRQVQVRIARKIGVTVDEAFPSTGANPAGSSSTSVA